MKRLPCGIAVALLLGVALCRIPVSALADEGGPVSAQPVFVESVADGDTVRVRTKDGRTEMVRYLLVDSPEVHHPQRGEEELGGQARRLNQSLVGGRAVYLEYDMEQRDVYGRLLAYVWFQDKSGWILVNERMARSGLCLYLEVGKNRKRSDQIRRACDLARREARGIWGLVGQGKRRYSEEQAWAEAETLRGRWILLALDVKKVNRKGKGVRIWGQKGRIRIDTYPNVLGGLDLRKGNRLVLLGNLAGGSQGWRMRWVDPGQRWEGSSVP